MNEIREKKALLRNKILRLRSSADPGMLAELKPDMLFCFSHTRKIPAGVLAVEGIRKINCHLGLLPEYRCLNPVNRAILNGETQAGFTLHELVEKMDAGDIYHRESLPIAEDDTVGSLTEKIVDRLKENISSLLRAVHSGRLKPFPQDPQRARYYPPLDYEKEGRINWDLPGEEILRKILALAPPWPGAYFYHKDKRIIVEKARFIPGERPGAPKVEMDSTGCLKATCKDGTVLVDTYRIG